MKAGDIGVLQNLTATRAKPYNGTVAEIMEVYGVGDCLYLKDQDGSELIVCADRPCFGVRLCDGQVLLVELHQIRPLDDPDAQERDTEREMELTV